MCSTFLKVIEEFRQSYEKVTKCVLFHNPFFVRSIWVLCVAVGLFCFLKLCLCSTRFADGITLVKLTHYYLCYVLPVYQFW